MHILVAPGAFKNSLTATAAAQIIARGLKRSGLEAEFTLLPIADGGNGTLDAFLATGGDRISKTVLGPLGEEIEAAFGLIDNGRTAVIEMALASGLELLPANKLDAMRTTTYGTGQLLQAALDAGVERVIIGMGGSATVDGGAGCMQALGVRFLDADGREIGHGGGALDQVARVDVSALDPRWRDVDVIIAADVDNPVLGERGAAYVFGPQKGAAPQQVERLEANLTHFFTLIAEQLGVDVRNAAGGGAAGGLAAGLMAFLGGHIVPGLDLLCQFNGFDAHLQQADLVITGEGRMDEQTIYGKGPFGVAQRAHAAGVPAVALVGGLAVDDAVLHEAGLQAVLPIVNAPMPLEQALRQAETLLEQAALRLGYLLAI